MTDKNKLKVQVRELLDFYIKRYNDLKGDTRRSLSRRAELDQSEQTLTAFKNKLNEMFLEDEERESISYYELVQRTNSIYKNLLAMQSSGPSKILAVKSFRTAIKGTTWEEKFPSILKSKQEIETWAAEGLIIIK